MAAAEVTFSGLGRFGIDFNEANTDRETNLTSRLRLQVDMSTESDVGLSLGARFRAETNHIDGKANSNGFNGGRVHASMGPLTLQAGNVGGAVDDMPRLYLPTSSIGTGVDGMGYNSVIASDVDGYSSAGAGSNNGLNLIYDMGPFGLQASYSTKDTEKESCTNDFQPPSVERPLNPNYCDVDELRIVNIERTDRTALRVSYTINDWTVAVAGQNSDTDTEDQVIFTVHGDAKFAKVGVSVADFSEDVAGKESASARVYGNVDVSMDTALTVWAADNRGTSAFGADVDHDLGGGATFVAGIVDTEEDDTLQAQAGVKFNF